MGKILKAKFALEYVAFFNIKLNTREGDAYLFAAVDAFTDFVFNLDLERDNSDKTVLKNIYQLTEHPSFTNLNTAGFTLVLEGHKNLKDQIEQIVHGVNGHVLFNKSYNNAISNPFLFSMLKYLKNK